jgi:hypothetical protein
MRIFSALIAVAFLTGSQAQAIPPAMYICHSPETVDAAWDVKLYPSSQGGHLAVLSNPRIGNVVPKPRGSPINVTKQEATAMKVVSFVGRGFQASLNTSRTVKGISFGGESYEGYAGLLNGELPDSGGTKASFNNVSVKCEVIQAMAKGQGGGR